MANPCADHDHFDAVVVGGGAAGVMTAFHLLQDADPAARHAIVEPRAVLGEGIAYATRFPEHVLNVVAANMSLHDDDRGHFVRYLQADAQRDPDIGTHFVARNRYGHYLRDSLDGLPARRQLQHVREMVQDLEPVQAGYQLVLASGRRLTATHVILATGNEARRLPLPTAAIHAAPRVAEAWDYDAVRRLEGDVCVIGSGLSMADVVASLADRGHGGHIHVLSRHGLLPRAHVADVVAGPADAIDQLMPLSLRPRVRQLRVLAAAAARAGRPWQEVMDALRPHGQRLWGSLDAADQARFLRHVVRHWDIHRHRVAPQVASSIERLRASGQLQVHAGNLVALRGDGAAVDVEYRPRGSRRQQRLCVSCVVNATGFETRLGHSSNPLLQNLLRRGLVRPGPHGLGVDSDAAGAVLDARGVPVDSLRVVGSPRIGTLWESVAIPELRGQARMAAQAVSASAALRES